MAVTRLIFIIDPQIAFCGDAGSLSKAFGMSELSVISERLRGLQAFLTQWPHRDELCVVRSEYRAGQFTGGDLNDPYSQACVPGRSDDCDLSLPQSVVAGVRVFTKHEESAAAISGLAELLRDGELMEVLVAGFLTTSCVRKTALAFRGSLPQPVTVGILEDLTASRTSNYRRDPGGVSRHEAALQELRRSGVIILHSSSILK